MLLSCRYAGLFSSRQVKCRVITPVDLGRTGDEPVYSPVCLNGRRHQSADRKRYRVSTTGRKGLLKQCCCPPYRYACRLNRAYAGRGEGPTQHLFVQDFSTPKVNRRLRILGRMFTPRSFCSWSLICAMMHDVSCRNSNRKQALKEAGLRDAVANSETGLRDAVSNLRNWPKRRSLKLSETTRDTVSNSQKPQDVTQ